MAYTIRRIDYFYTSVANQPGEAYKQQHSVYNFGNPALSNSSCNAGNLL